MLSDGATGVRDLGAPEKGWRKYWAIAVKWAMDRYLGEWIRNRVTNKKTDGWYLHDGFCDFPYWDAQLPIVCPSCGEVIQEGRPPEPVSNFIASTILACRLYDDGYIIESFVWWWGTFLLGGKTIKEEVGWFWVPKDHVMSDKMKEVMRRIENPVPLEEDINAV